MRIDNDCIRDILLTIEENTTYEHAMYFRDSRNYYSDRLQKYETDKILYHVRNLLLAGYLFKPPEIMKKYPESALWVDLSPSGHEFLNTIREPKVWLKTKELIHSAGSFSLKIVSATAEGVAKAYISSTLGIPIS